LIGTRDGLLERVGRRVRYITGRATGTLDGIGVTTKGLALGLGVGGVIGLALGPGVGGVTGLALGPGVGGVIGLALGPGVGGVIGLADGLFVGL
jgi:hypothetical protein